MWILIFALATSNDFRSGTGASSIEFGSKDACLSAANLMVQDANNRGKAAFSLLVCAPKIKEK